MARVVLHRVSLTDALAVDQVRRHEVIGSDRAGVADRERRVLQWGEKRSPHVDDLSAPLLQLFGLVGQQVANPLRARSCSVVDMHAGSWLARSAGRANLQA